MKKVYLVIIGILFIAGCQSNKESSLFELVPAEETGIDFSNTITPNDTLNFVDYTYVYNGGGVGVGDFNNDGLQDVFFAGNQVPNRLYINQDDFKFKDISESSGISADNRWSTGVALVDINYDGYLDIYVSVADINETEKGRNLLYVNNGDLSFTEMAAAYGIDDIGYSTQGAFFDYDKDGDLDLYVLTNYQNSYSQNSARPKVTDGSAKSNDRFYRNEGLGNEGHPVYKEVTREAGITIEGHGLGIAIADLNLDNWPDVYVANDFLTNDLVWINNQDGTFTNKANEYTKHQTHNGMGTDVNDFNNDGLPDIVVLDMLPEDNYRKKTMLGPMNYDRFMLNLDYSYEPQYVRNTLQLHNGIKPNGELSFSEIGELAGIEATDWSWAPLFADYDQDGYKDLWVTNGYRKDVTDLDYVVYQSQKTSFSSGKLNKEELKKLGESLQSVKVSNYIFKNNGDLTFSDKSKDWGIKRPSYSNGAAFADFDNDGDLDLVVNNIDDKAFVYKNKLDEQQKDSTRNFIRIKLNGPEKNQYGLGTKVVVKTGDKKLYHDHSIYRGYKSTVENNIHFGLGNYKKVDTISVFWLDGKKQLITNVKANQVININYKDATEAERLEEINKPVVQSTLFTETTNDIILNYQHEETDFVDFKYIPLIPKKYSQNGPGMAVGDINGDGLEDFVLGGAVRKKTDLFYQNADGTFTHKKSLPGDSIYEDMGILLFDADQDKDLDLFIASGSVEFFPEHKAFSDRLYINDGSGNFKLAENTLPDYRANGCVVTAADYDKDGDLDLFVGGQVIPREYPNASQSYILRNEGGKFTDVTNEVAKGLSKTGIVNSALWTDFNNDSWTDLIIVGEYMPITFYKNNNGGFENITSKTGLNNTEGWWNSIIGDDFDMDGDIDYVVGNYGLNNKYQPTPEEPLRVYVKDFDGNNTLDPIMTYYIQGKEYAAHPRDAMIDQMNLFRGKYNDYASYASVTFKEVFPESVINSARTLSAKTFASSYLENSGNGQFIIKELPVRAQFAPIYGLKSGDFDADGLTDILLVGNSHAVETSSGWQDASTGGFLKGNGEGKFSFVNISRSGFIVESDAKAMTEIYIKDQPIIMITSNKDKVRSYKVPGSENDEKIKLAPDEIYALITNNEGQTYKKEFYFGSGYLSQSSRTFRIPKNTNKVVIYDVDGNTRSIEAGEAI